MILILSYNSNPPTSGPHYPEAAKEGFYDYELPDEQLVHNLEHGDIWISYKNGLDQKIIDKLKEFAGRKIIITMRSKNDKDIALAAWRRLDKFNLKGNSITKEELKRISDFIKRYKNRGPEKVL